MCDIIKPKSFELSRIEFSEVKTNQYGGKVVYIRYNGGKLRIQTPKMSLPWGLNEDEVTDDKTGDAIGFKYSFNLSFRGMDKEHDETASEVYQKEARKLREVEEMLSTMNEGVIQQAKGNSISWLKQKKASTEVVKALYKNILLVSIDKETGEADGKWPDTIKAKLPFYEGVFKTEVYDENKEAVEVKKSIVKQAQVVSLLECTGIWFAGGKFGVGWKVVQTQIKYKPQDSYGYCAILDDSDDECDEVSLNDDGDGEEGDGIDEGIDEEDD